MAIGNNIAVGRMARLNVDGKTLCFAKAEAKSTREIVTNSDNTICGDIDTIINRAQKGRQIVAWSFYFDITWPIWEHLDGLLGLNNVSGDIYEMGATDDVTDFPVVLDMGDVIHSMPSCICAGWALRGQKGSRPVQMQFDIIGETESSTGSFSEDKLDIARAFAFTHGTLTLEDDSADPGADVARPYDRFLLQVDNGIVSEHNNSVTLTDATVGNRQAVFATSVPYITAHDDLYFDYRDHETGKNAVFVLSNDSKTLTFTMPAGLAIARPGDILGKADQIRTPVTLQLFRDDNGGTRVAPLTITPTGP